MENVNPYDPPLTAPYVSGEIGAVTSTIVLSPDHLVETLNRYRSQHRGRRTWRWARFVLASVFLLVGGGMLASQSTSTASDLATAGFMIALAVFMFLPHKIDDFFARRSFLKSPHCNIQQTMRFTDECLYSNSEVEDSTVKWTAFSRAVIFNDGVLIFQGPKLLHWIPDSSLQFSGDSAKFRNLVKSKLMTNQQKVETALVE